MVPTATLVLLVGGFLVTVILEAVVLMFAKRLQWFAHPNARSSHTVATPTLGGVAFVLPVLVYLGLTASYELPVVVGLLIGTTLVAAAGLWDDARELKPSSRLAAQAVAIGIVLWYLPLDWPWWMMAATVFVLVWHINLYNFMDGIDGIASSQCLLFCLGVLYLTGGVPGWLGDLLWILVGTALGFLVYNWPPAKIFMGDVGSGALGLILGVVTLQLAISGMLPFIGCLILLTGFWFDASYTLCVRMLSGQAFTEAHRSHLYQKVAARIGQNVASRNGHLWSTVIFLAFGIAWLLPMASFAVAFPDYGVLFQLVAILPMGIAAWRMRAGYPEPEDT